MENDVQFAEIFYCKQVSHSAFIPSQIVVPLKTVDTSGTNPSGTHNGIE